MSERRPQNRLIQQAARPNTIGYRDRELGTFVSALDTAERGDGVDRQYARWPFPNTSVPVRVLHPGGNEVELRLACRNLSRGGIGLFHSSYLHPGSRLAVYLPGRSGGETRVEGVVAWCVHREGIVHEIGVSFDNEVNIRDYIRPDLFEGWQSYERVTAKDLSGSILHVEPEEMDQKIMRHFLRETAIRVRSVGTCAEALESVSSGVDLILAEVSLPDEPAFEMISRLRAGGNHTPVILMSALPGPDIRAKVRFSGASAFLTKPFNNTSLLLAVAEFLLGPTEHSSKPERVESDFAMAYASKLSEYAAELDRLVEADRQIDAYVICVQIKGTAPSLGFEAIGQRAGWLANRNAGGVKLTEIRKEIDELTVACRKLRAA